MSVLNAVQIVESFLGRCMVARNPEAVDRYVIDFSSAASKRFRIWRNRSGVISSSSTRGSGSEGKNSSFILPAVWPNSL
jgi:hypothetical protein